MLALDKACKQNVLQPISLNIGAGEIVCLVGPSGCGKTTLLNLMAGLDKPTSGTLSNQAPATAYMFQEDRLLPWSTVAENIALVGKKDVQPLIDQVGLRGYENALPTRLSGGMQKRCAFARALHFDAPLLLLDEPFRSLDPKLRLEMCQLLLQTWKNSNKTIVLVTHDMDEALLLGHKVVVLSKGPAKIEAILDLPSPPGAREADGDLKNKLLQLLTKESRCQQ